MEGLIHPSMTELYALALRDAPYVVASYAIIWLGLAGYIVTVILRMVKLDKEVQVLQDTVDTKLAKITTSKSPD